MGKRYLALIKPLDKVFAEQNEGYKHKNKNLTLEEQEQLRELIGVLEPFYEVTELLSGEKYCTQSLILPSQNYLYKAVSSIANLEFGFIMY